MFPTSLNDKTTESVSQASLNTVGQAPQVAIGAAQQSPAFAGGLAATGLHAAVTKLATLRQAVTTPAVAALLDGD